MDKSEHHYLREDFHALRVENKQLKEEIETLKKKLAMYEGPAKS